MADIEVGMHFYPHHAVDAPPADLANAAVAHARLVDALGFDQLWTGHHYLTDDQTLQPIPLLGRLAGETRHVRIGAWLILSLGNPVDLAEQLSTLDALSDGRLICGAVMGYREVEFDSLGIPKRDRATRLEEIVEVLKRLWTQDSVVFEGSHVRLRGVSIHPKPVQKPRPRIWVGANSAPAVRRAARIGDAWAMSPYATIATVREHREVYDHELRALGRDPATVRRPLVRDVYIAPDDASAFAEAERFMAPFYQTYVRWGKEEAMGRGGELSQPFRELARDRFIIGSPSRFVEEIHRYHETVGADAFILQINRPGMPDELVLERTRLLGEAVLPRIR